MFTPIPLDRFGVILAHTPSYVWVLLAVLLALGARQAVTSRTSLRRATIMPIAMVGLSLYGAISTFGPAPAVLLAWAGAFAVTATLVTLQFPAPEGLRFDPAANNFVVPGSLVPLALMMGIFVVKYAVGVQTAMQPSLKADPAFMLMVATAYGAFSGMFAARGFRMMRLALAHHGILGQGRIAGDDSNVVA